MGLLLVVHLGIVISLFVTMPYGKFLHAVYRYAAEGEAGGFFNEEMIQGAFRLKE